MFGRKKLKELMITDCIFPKDYNETWCTAVFVEPGVYYAEPAVVTYIDDLKRLISTLKMANKLMQKDLERLIPIAEHKDFKPAISTECSKCKYGVTTIGNKKAIGCRKDIVCEDFKEKEE